MARRSKDWQDRRCKRKPDDTDALARIHTVIGDLPTYGYRRVRARGCKEHIEQSRSAWLAGRCSCSGKQGSQQRPLLSL